MQDGASESASIGSKIAAQMGGATGTPYYDIELTMQDGKKITLGRFISNKDETEWLVSEMRRLTGLGVKSAKAANA